jgi:hypothetical protein
MVGIVGMSRGRGLKRALILLLLVLVLGVAVGCGDDTDNGTSWSGTYSVTEEFGGGSGAVSFTVESNNTIFCFKFSGGAAGYSTACNDSGTDSFPINGNQFSISVSSTAQGTFTLQGQFPTSNHASGDVMGPSGSGGMISVLSWTASQVGESNQ